MSLSKYISNQKIFPLIIFDGFCVFLAGLIALAFRFDGHIPAPYFNSFIQAIPFIILLYCMINIPFGLYGHLWRYANAQEVVTIIGSTIVSTGLLFMVMLFTNPGRPIPLSVIILTGFFTMGAFTTIRYRQRLLTGGMSRLQRIAGSPDRQRVLIIGAGEAGQFLAQQIDNHSKHRRYELVGFIDDNPDKLGMRVQGVSILGHRADIPHLVVERSVSLIIIAIHNMSGPLLRDFLSICLNTQAQVKILPDFLGKMESYNNMLPFKDITPADLLGRQPSQIDNVICRELIAGKVILVTGAAGSIGSELCRQILNWQPCQLLMLDNNETGLHDLALTFNYASDSKVYQFNQIITPIIADIGNQAKMEHIFSVYQPQIVFHAAAYKHVPLMEEQPDEAVRINILGTKIVSKLAVRYTAERFVLISSDKAINPSSIMGATKRVGEMLITNMRITDDQSSPAQSNGEGVVDNYQQQCKPQNGESVEQQSGRVREDQGLPTTNNGRYYEQKIRGAIQYPDNHELRTTRFTAVRFGNVLGSRGSVVPTFMRQIELGGPVTVTHPEMTRYFMSISEAVSLVIQAGALTKGDDIFMLDMGQEIRITDLAHKMIRLRGLRPDKDIAVEYIGIRPGERFHEELLAPYEDRFATGHPNIFRIQTRNPHFGKKALSKQVAYLIKLSNTQQRDKLVKALWKLVQIDDERHAINKQASSVTHLT